MGNELKPCPFCGHGVEAVASTTFKNSAFVMCENCGASTDRFRCVDEAEAIRNASAAWNSRVNS